MRTLLRFIRKYSNFLLFLLLETLAVVLMVEGSSFQRSKIVGLNRQVSGFLYSKIDGAREYLSLKEMNQLLVLENLELRNRLEVYRRMTDSATVRRDFSDSVQFFYTPARVVNNSVSKQYNYITLDRGKKHGVYRNMGVVSDMGLVGIVLESSRNYSTVIPIINRDFRLSVKISSNNYSGILRWEGGSPLYATLSEIPFHVMLAEGDTILTSGFSSIFPEGIMVATIASFTLEQGNFYEIRVKLATEFQSLFHVNVIRNFRQEERLNLEAQNR
jgi:rod shape-determining protein MreC